MSSDETVEQELEAAAGEEQPSRASGILVLIVLTGAAVLILKAVVTVAPYTAYFVAGILACLGWQRVRGWIAARRDRQDADGEDELEEEPDVVEALQHLGRNGDHVLLTQLRKRLRVADTKAVKKLLKADGIRWRAGVRTPAGNGPGVHKDDIPAPPPQESAPSGSGCSCSSGPTTPTPTTDEEAGRQEGLRVVSIGDGSKIVYDPKDTIRHHRVNVK